MASEESMTQAMIQAAIDATKAAIMMVREVEGSTKSRRLPHMMSIASGLALRQQPIYDLKAQDK